MGTRSIAWLLIATCTDGAAPAAWSHFLEEINVPVQSLLDEAATTRKPVDPSFIFALLFFNLLSLRRRLPLAHRANGVAPTQTTMGRLARFLAAALPFPEPDDI